jgi:hypothetical protein
VSRVAGQVQGKIAKNKPQNKNTMVSIEKKWTVMNRGWPERSTGALMAAGSLWPGSSRGFQTIRTGGTLISDNCIKKVPTYLVGVSCTVTVLCHWLLLSFRR